MAESLNLVYITNSLEVGGAEVGMCRLLAELDSDDYNVTVVALNGNSKKLSKRIPSEVSILDLSLTSVPSFPDSIKFLRRVMSADVIVGSLYYSVMVARAVGALVPSAKVATWQHSSEFKTDLRKTVFSRTAGLGDVILADSEPVFEMLVEDMGFDEDLVHTVPIAGIDLDEYTQVTHADTSDIRVGSVGRVTRAKNYSTVLDVAERLRDSNVTFEIAGDGEQYEEIRADVEQRGLSNVSLLGQVDDVPSFLASLDIYFQPSLWEGLCITVIEAMAAGLPIVGSDVGGIGRNVEPGTSGFLYEPTDIDGFVSGIEMLASNPLLRERFGVRGREIVEESFTRSVLLDEFEEALRIDEQMKNPVTLYHISLGYIT